MADNIGFFRQVKENWNGYAPERNQYEQLMPIPTERYNKPYRSIDSVCSDLVGLLANPVRLSLNMLGFLLQSAVQFIVSAALVIPAVFAAICAPSSVHSMRITGAFTDFMSKSFVSFGMAAYALVAAIASVVLNPISVIARTGVTVLDRVGDALTPCVGHKCINV